MADFLDQKVREIRARLHDIEPLVREYNRLRDALNALMPGRRDSTPTKANRSQSPRTGTRRQGRPRAGQPTRADRLVELVNAQPGITVAQAAKAMSVAPNGLYQVVAKLSQEGRVRKAGLGLFPIAETSRDRQSETEPEEREVPEAAGD